MQACRLHTDLLSFLGRLTNESMSRNKASAELETQQGVFHLSASVICHGWGSPCLHKAPLPLITSREFWKKKNKKIGSIVLKKEGPVRNVTDRFVRSCQGSRQLCRPLAMNLRYLEAKSSNFINITLLCSYHVSSAGASVAETPPPPALPPSPLLPPVGLCSWIKV